MSWTPLVTSRWLWLDIRYVLTPTLTLSGWIRPIRNTCVVAAT